MPMDAQPRLYLPMLTVLSAASHAAGPRDRMSGFRDRIVVQREVSDVRLAVGDVPDELVAPVPVVRGEEDVLVRTRDLAEGRDHGRDVAVADVVLLAVSRDRRHRAAASAPSRSRKCPRRVRAPRGRAQRPRRRGAAPRPCAWPPRSSSSRSAPGRGWRPARCTSTPARRTPGSR